MPIMLKGVKIRIYVRKDRKKRLPEVENLFYHFG